MRRTVLARLWVLALGGLAAAATGCMDGGEPPSAADGGLDGKLLADGGGADAQPDAPPEAGADAGGGECTIDDACDDGLDCTIDTCVDNACVNEPNDAACDDGNECTTDSCDSDLGCQNEPITCDDGNPCTTDSCDSATGECANDPVDCDDGDACTTDSCDSATGECINAPVDCDDGDACTVDSCDPATGECINEPVDCDDGDACTVDSCDSATGECANDPVDCDDGVDCTTDTCDAVTGDCVNEPDDAFCDDDNECTIDSCDAATGCVNDPAPADGNDCTTDGGEAGTCNGGDCEIVDPTHYRMNTMELIDPHILLDVNWTFCDMCADITYEPVVDCFGDIDVGPFNDALHDSVTMDGDGDGLLDLSFVLELDPLDQTDGGGGDLTVYESDCTDFDNCSPTTGGDTSPTTYTSQASGTCLGVIDGTTDWNGDPATIHEPSGPCFVSGTTTLTLTFDYEGGVLTIPLRDVQVAGTYSGAPATGITDGLLRGFLSEEEADQIEVEMDGFIHSLGHELLPEEDHDCGPDGRDEHNGELGWWFYINYTADEVANPTGY